MARRTRRATRLRAARRALGPLDPFFEVRTPARNFGPARCRRHVRHAAGAAAGGRGGIDLARITPSGPHGRIVARDVEAAAATQPRAGAPPWRAARRPPRSWRSIATCRSRKCRSTACARPSPRGSCRPSRPSRISISPPTSRSAGCWRCARRPTPPRPRARTARPAFGCRSTISSSRSGRRRCNACRRRTRCGRRTASCASRIPTSASRSRSRAG